MPLQGLGKDRSRRPANTICKSRKAIPDIASGEIGEWDPKSEFLGNARALLFPIDWPEPFGLVMIEAMACGTPVIAFPNGSVPEIVDDGITGFIVDSIEAAAKAVEAAKHLDRIQNATGR